MRWETLFLAGLTDSYNPCSIGVLLISLTILMGLGRKKLIAIFGLSYLSAIFATYFLIGLGVLKAFHLFGVRGFLGIAAGIILILVGLFHLAPLSVKHWPIVKWFNRCHIPVSLNQYLDKGVFLAGAIMGVLIGLCTIPCAGGIYLGIIALLANSTTYWRGIGGLAIFNFGFILPLVLIFLFCTRQKVLAKIQQIAGRTAVLSTYILSLIMMAMGIILIVLAGK